MGFSYLTDKKPRLKTPTKALIIIVLAIILLTSCSRKKDKFVNRNFHAVTAEFNTLYNGYLALETGREILNENYTDNYWEVLPIERLEVREEVVLASQFENENFRRAEEKAVKAIQKHSMNIKGREKNPQMDEAYLLLGKARYYDQRFVPALAAFNNILNKYPTSDKINQVKIWREKANIRLDNNEIAIKKLKRLLQDVTLEDQDLADATSMLAQAYLNTKSVDSAITQLEIAAKATKSNDERGRFRFIQGQLYNTLGYKDSANIAFDKVIELNRKTPRIYMISAHIEKIKNFDYETGDKLALLEHLRNLEKNRENRPYLDKIYHQIGNYYLKNEADSLALVYYNKSLRTNSQDQLLKAENYLIIGDMNFEKSNYETAGYYYDSTMTNLALNSKPYRVIKRKRDNLEDVIYYENVERVSDSVLQLVNFSETERSAYFNTYVENLKVKAEADKDKQQVPKSNTGIARATSPMNSQTSNKTSQNQVATFYFYNPTTVAYGKNEFLKIWGSRTLQDNWRWSNQGTLVPSNNTRGHTIIAQVPDEERYNPQYYISKIPSEERVIDSILKARNFANYQLGLIYMEKFKAYPLSKSKFLKVLKSNPEERLIVPSKYNLYKIYELLGQKDEAAMAKNEIINKYPESRYALILNNPESVNQKDKDSPDALYERVYALHENQEYAQVIAKSEAYINRFEGTYIVPKFELLKATAMGRLLGFDAYEKAINYVAVTFANTPEGRQAEKIKNEVLPKIAHSDFNIEAQEVSAPYKVVFRFNDADDASIESFKETLDSILKNLRYYNLKTSLDVYKPHTKFIVVHGLNNAQVAKTFDQLFSEEDYKKIKEPYFAISSANYQKVQIHKNLESYLNINNK